MAGTLTPTKPDLSPLLLRYLDGESIQVLAAENHVHRSTLYRWMLAGLGDEHYFDLVTDALVARIAEADGELDDIKTDLNADECDIARAREKISIAKEHMRYSRFDFERRRPHLYGPKQELTIDHRVDIRAAIVEAKARLGSFTTSQNDENVSQNAETPMPAHTVAVINRQG